MTTSDRFDALTLRLWPELATAPSEIRRQGRLTLLIILINLPLVLIALVWLALVSDLTVVGDFWPLLLFILGLIVLLERQQFVIVLAFGPAAQLPITSSLAGMVHLTAVLIFGPTVIWMLWLSALVRALVTAWQSGVGQSRSALWGPLSALVQETGAATLSLLFAAWAFSALGGSYPFAVASPLGWLPALAATVAKGLSLLLLLIPTILALNWLVEPAERQHVIRRFWLSGLTIMLLTYPFAVPLALTYGLGGTWLFVAVSLGVLLANWLAHHLSRANLRSQLRSRELAQLERLGADLLAAPADASTLPDILEAHLPLLFPYYRCQIRLFAPEEDGAPPVWPLFDIQHPPGEPVAVKDLWRLLRDAPDDRLEFMPAHVADPFLQRWSGVALKILARTAEDDGEPAVLGGIAVLYADNRAVEDLALTMQELGGQIASALAQATSHANNVARLRLAHELEVAGRIQASFLPDEIPAVAGWDIAATLVPARQTAGDFFDFIPLPGGRLAVVVADVADKGTGAALFMALTRTLLRTYAIAYPDEPARVLQATNERILADTNTDQFVTAFYGVLDPHNGRFCYANAGHNPALFLSEQTRRLGQTGIPLGIFEDRRWTEASFTVAPGDLLCLYSDGITEAPNDENAEFGEERLLAILGGHPASSAPAVQAAVIDGVRSWTNHAAQFDDMTLLLLKRDEDGQPS